MTDTYSVATPTRIIMSNGLIGSYSFNVVYGTFRYSIPTNVEGAIDSGNNIYMNDTIPETDGFSFSAYPFGKNSEQNLRFRSFAENLVLLTRRKETWTTDIYWINASGDTEERDTYKNCYIKGTLEVETGSTSGGINFNVGGVKQFSAITPA